MPSAPVMIQRNVPVRLTRMPADDGAGDDAREQGQDLEARTRSG